MLYKSTFPTLKYAALAAALQRDIDAGIYKPGDKLPPERTLAETHEVALLTMRQALTLLKDRGVIIRRQGSGTFVASPSPQGQASAPPAAGTRPGYLIGLSPDLAEPAEAVNWEVRLLRYQGIVEAGFQRGMPIQCHEISNQGQNSDWMVETFRTAAGLILHDHGNPVAAEGIRQLCKLGVPVVAINRYTTEPVCSEVRVDVRQGACAAVSHLASLGHQHIAIIVGDQKKTPMRLRFEGYQDALKAYDLRFDDSLVYVDPAGSAEGGAAGARALLSRTSPPSAIFAATDQRASGVYRTALEMGLSIPTDLAVVGFDNLRRTLTMSPPLTTVNNPLYQSGQQAVYLLDELRHRPDTTPQVRLIQADLIVRKSCGQAVSQAS